LDVCFSFDVGRSMFDVGCSSFSMFDVNLSKQLSAYPPQGGGQDGEDIEGYLILLIGVDNHKSSHERELKNAS